MADVGVRTGSSTTLVTEETNVKEVKDSSKEQMMLLEMVGEQVQMAESNGSKAVRYQGVKEIPQSPYFPRLSKTIQKQELEFTTQKSKDGIPLLHSALTKKNIWKHH